MVRTGYTNAFWKHHIGYCMRWYNWISYQDGMPVHCVINAAGVSIYLDRFGDRI